MHRLGISILTLQLLLAPALGSSQPPGTATTVDRPSHSSPLTLEHLIATAHASNPTIQQALAEVEKARGRRFQATRYPNPKAGYTAAEISNEGNAGQQGLFVSQTFVTAGKLELNDQVRGWDVQRATWNWKTQQYRVENSVRVRYFELLAARRRNQVARKIVSSTRNALDVANALLDAGEVPRSQVLQATVELRRAELAERNAETKLTAAERRLVAMVGHSGLDVDSISGDLNSSPPPLEFDAVLAWLYQNSPQLQSARAAVAQSQWAAQRARVEPVPDLQSQLAVQYDDSTRDTVAGVQLGMQLPVFDKNRGNIRAADGERIRACSEVRRLELSLRDRLSDAFGEYTTAAQSVAACDDSLIPLAQETLQLTLESFRLGESSYLTLLTAQRTYFDTVLNAVDARRRLWQSVVTIRGLLVADGLAAP